MPENKSSNVIAWLRAFVRSDSFDRFLLACFVLVVLLGLGTSYADFRRLTEERKAGRSVADAEPSIAGEVLRLVDREAFFAAAPDVATPPAASEAIEIGDAAPDADEASDE